MSDVLRSLSLWDKEENGDYTLTHRFEPVTGVSHGTTPEPDYKIYHLKARSKGNRLLNALTKLVKMAMKPGSFANDEG